MNNNQELAKIPCNKCDKKCSVLPFELDLVEVQENLQDLIKEFNNDKYLSRWVFRGQLSCHSMQTSLERLCRMSGFENVDIPAIEKEIVREFRRHYDGDDRDRVRDDMLYCLSVMQHYGAPTRLLDWTYSPYVALYFGLQYAVDSGEPFAVWCIDSVWSEETTKKVYREDTEFLRHLEIFRQDEGRQKGTCFNEVFMQKDRKLVSCPINSFTNSAINFYPSRKADILFIRARSVKKCYRQDTSSYSKSLLFPRKALCSARNLPLP